MKPYRTLILVTPELKAERPWQFEAESIDTDKVQWWRNGVMLTAQLAKADACEMVERGTAYVISGQAIGVIYNGYLYG